MNKNTLVILLGIFVSLIIKLCNKKIENFAQGGCQIGVCPTACGSVNKTWTGYYLGNSKKCRCQKKSTGGGGKDISCSYVEYQKGVSTSASQCGIDTSNTTLDRVVCSVEQSLIPYNFITGIKI